MGQQLIEKLEAVHIHGPNQGQAAIQPQGKKTAHVIAELAVARQAGAGQLVGPGGSGFAPATEALDLGLGVEAAADHKVEVPLLKGGEGLQDGAGLVLAVAVHHHDQIAGGIEQSLLDGAG